MSNQPIEVIPSPEFDRDTPIVIPPPKRTEFRTQQPEDTNSQIAERQIEALEDSYQRLHKERDDIYYEYYKMKKELKLKKQKIISKNIKYLSLQNRFEKQNELFEQLIKENKKLKKQNKKYKKQKNQRKLYNAPLNAKASSPSFSQTISLSMFDVELGEIAENEDYEDDTYDRAKKYVKKYNTLDGFIPKYKNKNN